MLNLGESSVDERRRDVCGQGKEGLGEFEEAGECGSECYDEGAGPECELGDNEVSLEMFSQELDTISLSSGMVENIWYVELESGGEIIWSSVIACELFRQEGALGGGEGKFWEGLGSRAVWDKRKLFGGDVNVITRKQLCDLLSRDGITDRTSTSLFASVGLWKSLFLALNYSTYVRRKRELLYSKLTKRFIVRFNKRRETVERRMGVAPDEDERNALIGRIYNGIRDLFGSVSASSPDKDRCVGGVCGKCLSHVIGREVFKATYKAPFYWASLMANAYLFEKLGQYDLMLAVIEYISEVSPELIFDFKKHSRSYFCECVTQDGGHQRLVESLCVFNNELLQSISACFQEYLSDLLSVTEKSRSILSSYLVSPEGTQSRGEGVKDRNAGVKVQAKAACLQYAKREPNYMRPTQLSEIRRQNSRKTSGEKTHYRREDKGDVREDCAGSDRVGADVEQAQGKEGGALGGVGKRDLVDLAGGGGVSTNRTGPAKGGERAPLAFCQSDERSGSGASEGREAEVDPGVIGESDGAEGRGVGVHQSQGNNLDVILSILEEKSKPRSSNKVSFDDELFNIISEIDQIHFSNAVNDVSTNISDDFAPHDTGGSSAGPDYAGDEGFADSPVERRALDDFRDGGAGDASRQEVTSIKSPLDPYDWYYLSGNDENGVSKNVQVGGNLVGGGGSKDRVAYMSGDRATTLISLDENQTLNGGEESSSPSTAQAKQGRPPPPPQVQVNELKYIESVLDKEIEELQKQEDELASSIYF